MSVLALFRRVERRDTRELVLRSLKFKWRSLHPRRKSGELHLPIRVGSGFKIELPHSAKTIGDMNLDRGCVNGFAVRIPDCKFEGTGTSTALYDGNFFVGRWSLSPRKQRGCDENGAQNTMHSVHMLTIIRARGDIRSLDADGCIVEVKKGNPGF
jgi:hypothetical protein